MTSEAGILGIGRDCINYLRSSPTQRLCAISHTPLFDDGCEVLFRWLTAGDDVSSQQVLTALQNDIEGTADIAEALISSLQIPSLPIAQTSALSALVLSNNPLSPAFKSTLFALLPNLPSLRLLHLSMTNITPVDALALAAYISDERCQLAELHANANTMGYAGARAVVCAVSRCWTMERVDLYSNATEDPAVDAADDGQDQDYSRLALHEVVSLHNAIGAYAPGSGCSWTGLQTKLKYHLAQHTCLKHAAASEARQLLKYARIMLRNARPAPAPTREVCADCECTAAAASPSPLTSAEGSQAHTPVASSFSALPTELQLHILSALAPTLSSAQHLRVIAYASDTRTLPALRLCLPLAPLSRGGGCVADPGALGYAATATRGLSDRAGKKVGSLRRRGTHACASGSCMGRGSVVCQRETARDEWLTRVGCDRYDPSLRRT
ncbi:hypothetical protein HYPSUDRAFT_58460 [Hypholoma sublateritium FD-334 SS-4]|uniref:Uncharacterized protein n=1 Tax=Hypholoma sublateritium (strain FD-334 SS-4) TaxID=945553 RepID=A0A0D2LYV6_HYPSF|nr:hypothetical protein HYPSUDRAFT_58460 [Hypholoma sublateritium FD-334 SS-4]